jgi:hypothetical protein
MDESLRTGFLEMFSDDSRNLITQQFCAAVRAGERTAEEVTRWVAMDCERRCQQATDEQKKLQIRMVNLLDTIEARNFASYIIWRESLSREDRQKLKAVQSQKYIKEKMSEQPPTEKQLKYLQGLGCQMKPENKQQASELIEQFLHR